jgi:hypothetical protein
MGDRAIAKPGRIVGRKISGFRYLQDWSEPTRCDDCHLDRQRTLQEVNFFPIPPGEKEAQMVAGPPKAVAAQRTSGLQ